MRDDARRFIERDGGSGEIFAGQRRRLRRRRAKSQGVTGFSPDAIDMGARRDAPFSDDCHARDFSPRWRSA